MYLSYLCREFDEISGMNFIAVVLLWHQKLHQASFCQSRDHFWIRPTNFVCLLSAFGNQIFDISGESLEHQGGLCHKGKLSSGVASEGGAH
jgi:hypothetical protein